MRLTDRFRGAWLAALAAALDRITKRLAVNTPAGPLIPGLVNLRPTVNRGMAFSMLSGQGALLTALTLLLVLVLTAWLVAKPGQPRLFRAGLWLIVGGGLGNLWDRLASGAVIDFIEPTFVRFAVFNAADACICLGAALAMLSAILEETEKKHGA